MPRKSKSAAAATAKQQQQQQQQQEAAAAPSATDGVPAGAPIALSNEDARRLLELLDFPPATASLAQAGLNDPRLRGPLAAALAESAFCDDTLAEGSGDDDDFDGGIDLGVRGDDDSFDEICQKAQSIFSEATRDYCQRLFGGSAEGGMALKAAAAAASVVAASGGGKKQSEQQQQERKSGPGATLSPAEAQQTLLAHLLKQFSAEAYNDIDFAAPESDDDDDGCSGGGENDGIGIHRISNDAEIAGLVFDSLSHPMRARRSELPKQFSVHATLPLAVLRGVVPPPVAPATPAELEQVKAKRREELEQKAKDEPVAAAAAEADSGDKKDDNSEDDKKKSSSSNTPPFEPLEDPVFFPNAPLQSELRWTVEMARIVQRNEFIVPTADEWDEGMTTSDIESLTRQAASGSGPTATAAQQQLFMRRAGVNKLPLDPAHAWSWNDTGTKMDSRDRFTLREMGIKKHGPNGGENEVFRRQDCFLKALTLDAATPEPWLNLALTLERGGVKTVKIQRKSYSAIDCVVQALEIEPQFGAAWCALGLELAVRTREAVAAVSPAGAVAAAKEAQEKFERGEPVHAKLPTVTVAGEPVDVFRALVHAIRHAPFFFTAWYTLGHALLWTRQPSVDLEGVPFDAANCFYRALLLDPTQASAWHHLALAMPTPTHRFAIFGRLYQTRDCLVQALSIDPHMVKAWCALYAISPTVPQQQGAQLQQQVPLEDEEDGEGDAAEGESPAESGDTGEEVSEEGDVPSKQPKGKKGKKKKAAAAAAAAAVVTEKPKDKQQQLKEKQLKLQLLQSHHAAQANQPGACSSPSLLRVRGYPVHDRHHITAALTALTAETRLLSQFRGM